MAIKSKFKVSQGDKIFCHDPEVMGLNPSEIKLGGA